MSAPDDQSQSGQESGPPDPPPGNGAPQAGPQGYGRQVGTPAREDEVSLLDILLVLARNKRIILGTILGVTLLGLTYAVLAPEQYTSDARVVRETQTDSGVSLPGGISPGMLSGLGVSLGGGPGG